MAHMLKLVCLELARWSLAAHTEAVWKRSEGQRVLKALGVMQIVMSSLTYSKRCPSRKGDPCERTCVKHADLGANSGDLVPETEASLIGSFLKLACLHFLWRRKVIS